MIGANRCTKFEWLASEARAGTWKAMFGRGLYLLSLSYGARALSYDG
jgi:hypothetical protein